MDAAIGFVEGVKSGKAKVLLHCFMGVNRSATIAMALLVVLEGMTLRQAFDHVGARRKIKVVEGNKVQISSAPHIALRASKHHARSRQPSCVLARQDKIAAWEERRTGSCTMPEWKR